jgi:hypothetical protein
MHMQRHIHVINIVLAGPAGVEPLATMAVCRSRNLMSQLSATLHGYYTVGYNVAFVYVYVMVHFGHLFLTTDYASCSVGVMHDQDMTF